MTNTMFTKILIANRGEIACRVIRTCRRLGIRTVAVYSDADADAQHVRQADEAHHIGAARPQESYLRGDVILDVAKKTGAQAIHPGYGFLSENADFADAVEAAGIVFIGPKAASMRKMGSKAGAKDLMQAAGVPVVPGYTGEDQSPDLLQREADTIGYPLMIKAAHGGGGKGMRIVRNSSEFLPNLESCQREARNAFGRDRVLLERYVEKPRHIEIQIFGDAFGDVIHLNERECSAQRRYQKVLEESPSPFLTPDLRNAMGAAAVQAGHAIDYQNAGTVEFIVGQDGHFYFMEINTRLQVEHPVTEYVTGLDLVEWQLRVAAGEPLPASQEEVPQRGHAIEVRLYAEDPEAGFLPGSGKLQRLRLPPPSAHVRLDAGVIEGDTVTIFYDPMIAKLIVWDEDRPRALARLRDALAQCAIDGPKSNIAFLERLIRHPSVVNATIDTGTLDRDLDAFMPTPAEAGQQRLARMAAATALLMQEECATRSTAAASSDPTSPWAQADGWRLGHAGLRRLVLDDGNARHTLLAHGVAGDYRLEDTDGVMVVAGATLAEDHLFARFDGQGRRMLLDAKRNAGASSTADGHRADVQKTDVHDGERRWRFTRVPAYQPAAEQAGTASDRVLAPMPGRIVVMKAQVGDRVERDQELLVMEAMKMELALKAPCSGVVAEIRVGVGDFVEADAVLVVLSEEEDA